MTVREWDQECKACKGRGLYVGFAEAKGAAVVCRICDGTGKVHARFEFNEFTGRKAPPADTMRVFAANPGMRLSADSQGGVPLAEWLKNPASANAPGREVRDDVCPGWYQTANGSLVPEFNDDERRCESGTFRSCRYFEVKDGCWAKWDKEVGYGHKK